MFGQRLSTLAGANTFDNSKSIDEIFRLVSARPGSILMIPGDRIRKELGAALPALLELPIMRQQAARLQSEIISDTSVAENLLSTIEQSLATQLEIEKNTKKIAENTSLQLEKDRGAAFIDIAAGGLRQYGNFLSGVSPITFASQAASVVLSSLAADTARKTDNELLSELVAINKDMRILLAEIALNTNRAAGNFAGLTESELIAMIDNLRSRS